MAKRDVLIDNMERVSGQIDQLIYQQFDAKYSEEVMQATEPKLKRLKQEFISITHALTGQ